MSIFAREIQRIIYVHTKVEKVKSEKEKGKKLLLNRIFQHQPHQDFHLQ